jgi:aryl-alcohol dehydrogenase-like predicted oxidoreductase
VEAVITAAEGLGTTPLGVALAWLHDRPGVVAPIVGARTAQQLQAALDADGVRLPPAIVTALDDVSSPPFSYPERRPEQ